jgi:RNA polymerase sigma factor (sigma-70 family)
LQKKEQPDGESDTALVARFARLRDEVAFAVLMARHGPLVMGACVRMLAQRQDAEDAFQAVFVTLSAKARALRRVRSLAGWLHNVAVRVSLNLIKMNRRHEQRLGKAHDSKPTTNADRQLELRELLDEELTALPARYREAVVLCDLQGYTREEAARKLAIPAGTVGTWVARGRRLLRDRLVRRGVTLSTAALAAGVSRLAEAAPQISSELAQATVRNAELFLAGEGAAALSAATRISSLAQGVIHTMFLTKLSTTVCIAALAAALVLGATPVSRLVGLASSARAQEFAGFTDNFDDGSATDGNPVK